MSKTIRRKPYGFGRKEEHVARVISRKRYRAKVRNALHRDLEALPIKRGTEGWISW